MAEEKAKLGVLRAVTNAFFGVDVSFFPRFRGGDGNVSRVEDTDLIREMGAALRDLESAKAEELETLLSRSRESLDEVKGLTEYQDQKSTRLLTIITFLSALSGVLFARLVESFPLQQVYRQFGLNWQVALIASAYLFFFAFALAAGCGALIVFHATRTRFKYPVLESGGAPRSQPRSFLFYSSIVEVRPAIWANAFLSPNNAPKDRVTRSDANESNTSSDNGVSDTTGRDPGPSAISADGARVCVNPALALSYAKNHIIESYLVAAKTADKLRYLEPAQDALCPSGKGA